jgi:hypothetical protein
MMKLRLALGIVIVLYAVVGLLIRFSDMALGYYQNLISAVESNGPISRYSGGQRSLRRP